LDDTINRAISTLYNKVFEKWFLDWCISIQDSFLKQVITLDGKIERGIKSLGEKSTVHTVSA